MAAPPAVEGPPRPVDAPERGPAVLLVGGLLTSPPWYWPLRSHLLRRGASRVAVAPVWLYHWLDAAFLGPERGTNIVAGAIERLHREDGRPILVIGHSGGGLLARLALARRRFGRTRRAAPGSVGALVTLGTPHLATRFGGTIGRHGLRVVRFLAAEEGPSTPTDPPLVTVGSTVPEHTGRFARLRRTFTATCYRALLGPTGAREPGDGMVPLRCAVIPERDHVILEGFAHAPLVATRWYFSGAALDAWWDVALDAWRRGVSAGAAVASPA